MARFVPARAMSLASLLLCSSAAACEFEAVYTADILGNASGGNETGTRYLDNLDLTVEVDIDESWGLGAGTLFGHVLYNNGTALSDDLVGDLLVSSNIDASRAWRVFEFWYEFGGDRWSLRTGLYDLNSEFDVNEAGALFLNSSHGIGADFSQTGENGPSIFPISSLAVRTAYETEAYAVRAAILDGVPGDPEDPSSNKIDISREGGALLVGELELPLGKRGRLWTGYWRYAADFESPFDGRVRNDNDGWYIGGEYRVALRERDLAWFVRYGQAEAGLNPLGEYLGAGIVLHGLLPGRPDDEAGVAVASGRTGRAFRSESRRIGGDAASHETAWELTYRLQVSDYLAVQPDLQLVQNPGGLHEVADAWVIGVRVEVSY